MQLLRGLPRTSEWLFPTAEGKSTLILKKGPTDDKDVLVWKWTRGEATESAAFGDPGESDGYSLCLYADADGSPELRSDLSHFGKYCRRPRTGDRESVLRLYSRHRLVDVPTLLNATQHLESVRRRQVPHRNPRQWKACE